MNQIKSIVFIFDGLQMGGVERVGIDYVNLLVKNGYTVTIVNASPKLNSLYYQLPKDCKIIEFNFPRKLVPYRYTKGIEKGLLGTFAYLCIGILMSIVSFFYCFITKGKLKSLKNNDITIAFSGHFNDLYLTAKGYIPGKKVAWLHGAEFEYKMISEGYFNLYKKIGNLVCLSELCDIVCRKYNDRNNIRKVKIYNPILIQDRPIDIKKVDALKEKYGKFVLMVGRLDPDKDQRTVIQAIKWVNERKKEPVHLLLAGDGINRDSLMLFSTEQKMLEYVHFLGNCEDIQNYYEAAYIYAHSSPMEGLPTVLLEALAYGVPIASTDSIPGVQEILMGGEYGLISPVDDWKALGANILRLYEEPSLYNLFSEKGKERILDFAPQRAIQQFEQFIQHL